MLNKIGSTALHRKFSIAVCLGLLAMFLASCSSSGAGFEKDMDTALGQVPGVVAVTTQYRTDAGMSTRINVRLTASPDASLDTVLTDSLHTFANKPEAPREPSR